MQEVVINELTHEGMRRVKVIGDSAIIGDQWWRYVPGAAIEKVCLDEAQDQALGLFSMELKWPVYGPWEVFCYGQKRFRRFMVVNYAYAERVSECIELARVAFFAGTHFAPGYAFVKSIPSGGEEWIDVHGLMLLEAEWMPERCVAVGGSG